MLGGAYSHSNERRREFVEALLEASELVVQSPDLVRAAVRLVAEGADFADSLVALSSKENGCDQVMTFDEKAAAHGGMTLLSS